MSAFTEIFQDLADCITEIHKCREEFSQKISEIKEQSQSPKFKQNKSFDNSVNIIKLSLDLFSYFCGLWNIEDSSNQISIADAFDGVIRLYRERRKQKETTFKFVKINQRYEYQDEKLCNITDNQEKQRKFSIIREWLNNIRNNKLALLPYIFIDNASKYALNGTDINVIYKYIDENRCEITVENIGPAIGDDEKIFEYQERGENAKKIRSGSGRGLSFATKILDAHGCNLVQQQEDDPNLPEQYNGVQYKCIKFIITINLDGITSTENITEDLNTYYRDIDNMFNHEYSNSDIRNILDTALNKLQLDLELHYTNIGLIESEANELMNYLDKFNDLKRKLYFILAKYEYRDNIALEENNKDTTPIYWTDLYREASKLYNKEMEDAHVNIDARVEGRRLFVLRVRRQIEEYRRTEESPIKSIPQIRDIPLLVYGIILGLARKDSEPRITLSASSNNVNYAWSNIIELEVSNTCGITINEVVELMNREESMQEVYFNTHVALLISMLKKYLDKINSRLQAQITPNDWLKFEFTFENEIVHDPQTHNTNSPRRVGGEC